MSGILCDRLTEFSATVTNKWMIKARIKHNDYLKTAQSVWLMTDLRWLLHVWPQQLSPLDILHVQYYLQCQMKTLQLMVFKPSFIPYNNVAISSPQMHYASCARRICSSPHLWSPHWRLIHSSTIQKIFHSIFTQFLWVFSIHQPSLPFIQ